VYLNEAQQIAKASIDHFTDRFITAEGKEIKLLKILVIGLTPFF